MADDLVHGITIEEVNDATPIVNAILQELGVISGVDEKRAREVLLAAIIATKRAAHK